MPRKIRDDFGRRVVRIGRLGHDERRVAVLAHVASRGDDCLGDLVPMLIGIQGIGHPDGERRRGQQCPIFLAAIKDHVAPIACPILPILLVGQQSLHHRPALVRLGVEARSGSLPRARGVRQSSPKTRGAETFRRRPARPASVSAVSLRRRNALVPTTNRPGPPPGADRRPSPFGRWRPAERLERPTSPQPVRGPSRAGRERRQAAKHDRDRRIFASTGNPLGERQKFDMPARGSASPIPWDLL